MKKFIKDKVPTKIIPLKEFIKEEKIDKLILLKLILKGLNIIRYWN